MPDCRVTAKAWARHQQRLSQDRAPFPAELTKSLCRGRHSWEECVPEGEETCVWLRKGSR